MKTVLLMRHAKSSWKHKKIQDIERPLNARGEKEAPEMGRLLLKKDILPDLIVSSPALRARTTAELVAKKCHYEKDILYIDKLYMAEAPEILNNLNTLSDEVTQVLLIAHNPGVEYTLQLLTGKVESMPTSSIVKITLPIEHWSEISTETKGELVKIWRPKD